MDQYQTLAERLLQSRYVVALTGAGISVESGIPDFRSQGGLWSRYDPMEFGHIESFRANPGKVWQMLLEIDTMLLRAEPNPAHRALAELERRGMLEAIITQNIDSLHQRAGSRNVIEFHGHNRTLRCDWCEKPFERERVSLEDLPPLCSCGGALRPDFVFFGEMIPPAAYQQAVSVSQQCDLMLVVGTSATVAPASLLPLVAKQAGALLVEINPAITGISDQVTDFSIPEPAGQALPAIVAALDARGRS